jgi:DNA polymerase V
LHAEPNRGFSLIFDFRFLISDFPMFALIDCNAFFVSCERLFDPRLAKRPVVVLSSNDGCAVSRSDEAKALGVPMGAPHFEFRELEKTSGLVCLSSNFELYAEMSKRVMSLFVRWSPDVEVYSIDEAFLSLRGRDSKDDPEGLRGTAEEIRAATLRWTGIPVSVGVAPTKTLAKAASDAAKNDARAGRDVSGVRVAVRREDADRMLAGMEARDVWGIGRNLSRWLGDRGIHGAAELAQADTAWIRKHLGVTVERTVLELRGLSCLPLNSRPGDQKNMAHMRSFARPVGEREAVRAAVLHHAERAAMNLRREGLVARAISVHLATDRHRPGDPQHRGSRALPFPVPTDLTPEIVKRASECFDAAFLPGFRYKKAGIVLHDLVRPELAQGDLFDPVDRPRAARLMAALDGVQARHGTSALHYGFAAATGREPWRSRADRRTPRYTTRWEELAGVG